MINHLPLSAQLIHMAAAALLLLSFAMLAQRRILSLVNLFAAQGLILVVATVVVAYTTRQQELYYSAALTFLLKVLMLPYILRQLIRRLNVSWDREPLVNIPATMLIGLGIVIFAFGLAQPISQIAHTITRSTLGIALAVVLLSFLMVITRRRALGQVMGFLAMENGLLFAAMSATYGMPMVMEIGVALDVLVGIFILGIFFFHIQGQFENLDLHKVESVKGE